MKLSSTIAIGTGPLIFIPRNQTGLIAQWDPSIAATINTGAPANGDLINTVADSVGGFTLTKFNDSYRPTYTTNVANGQPAITYAGATQSVRSASDVIPCGAWSVVMVVKAVNTGNASFLYTFSNEANGYDSFLYTGTAPSFRTKNSGGSSNKNMSAGAGWLNNSLHSLIHVNDGTHAGATVYKDNVAMATSDGSPTTDPGTASFSRRFSLGTSGGLGSPYAGHFLYIAIVNHALDANERRAWHHYFAARFGLVS